MDESLIPKILPLLIPVIVIQFGLMIVALLDLLRRDRLRFMPKWGWLLVIVLVNFIGPIVYFAVGRDE